MAAIRAFNDDDAVDAMIVQHPTPPQIDYEAALSTMDPDKDADGLHPANLGRLALSMPGPVPCTPAGIEALLAHYRVPVAGRHVVILGRGFTLGRPLALLLSQKRPTANAAVTVVHTGVPEWAEHTRRADIVIAAAGVPGILQPGHVRPGAVVVGGVRYEGRRILPDVDESVAEVAGWITPGSVAWAPPRWPCCWPTPWPPPNVAGSEAPAVPTPRGARSVPLRGQNAVRSRRWYSQGRAARSDRQVRAQASADRRRPTRIRHPAGIPGNDSGPAVARKVTSAWLPVTGSSPPGRWRRCRSDRWLLGGRCRPPGPAPERTSDPGSARGSAGPGSSRRRPGGRPRAPPARSRRPRGGRPGWPRSGRHRCGSTPTRPPSSAPRRRRRRRRGLGPAGARGRSSNGRGGRWCRPTAVDRQRSGPAPEPGPTPGGRGRGRAAWPDRPPRGTPASSVGDRSGPGSSAEIRTRPLARCGPEEGDG